MGEDQNFQQDEPDNNLPPTETTDEPADIELMEEDEQGEEEESDEEDLTSEGRHPSQFKLEIYLISTKSGLNLCIYRGEGDRQ